MKNKLLILSIIVFNTSYLFSQNEKPSYDVCVRTNIKKLNSENITTYKVFSSDTINLLGKTRIELYVFKKNKVKNNWSTIPLYEVDQIIIDKVFQSRFSGGYFDLRTYNRKGLGIYSEAFDKGKLLYQYFHKSKDRVKKRDYVKNGNHPKSKH